MSILDRIRREPALVTGLVLTGSLILAWAGRRLTGA